MDVISKKQMSEEDIKLHYITPAITAQWNIQHITMETKVTDGRINLKGNLVIREKPKRADYVLYVSANNPIAIVEAKDNNHAVSYGLQQAMTYAQMLDVPFAYSSNGDGFMEHDFLTGKEREFGLDEFPTEQELIQRYGWRKRRCRTDPRTRENHSAAVLQQPKHLPAPLLSAHCHQPHSGCHRKRERPHSVGYGHRYRQNLHGLPNRIPPTEKRHEEENPVLG